MEAENETRGADSPSDLERGRQDSSSSDFEEAGKAHGVTAFSAVAIFPEEIWRMILGNLTDPQDLWRCSNTCELFANILSKWRPGWMMEVALPYLYHHLPRNKLLECRLVCTGWNKKINNFLEDHPSLRPYASHRDPRKLEYINPVLEKGLHEKNIYNLWNQDCNPHLQVTFTGNPFLGRYVTLMMCKGHHDDKPQEETVTQFYEKLYKFLQLYGKEIFYLNFWYDVQRWSSTEETMEMPPNEVSLEKSKFIQLVTADLFPFVPNLRKLKIDGALYEGSENVNIPPESLPPAPMLESLEVDDNYLFNHPDPLYYALLIKYHAQLRKLNVQPAEWDVVRRSHEWLNLTELNIKITVDDKFWDLTFAGARMPSLSKLGLALDEMGDSFNFDKVMKGFVVLCSATRLDTLRLTVLESQPIEEEEDPEMHWIAPSNIETLELDDFLVTGPRSSYSFLLLKRFPYIKNLHIFLRHDRPEGHTKSEVHLSADCSRIVSNAIQKERSDEIVEVNKFLGSGNGGGSMYESNIWDLLRLLNVFTFQRDVYTREGYEEYSRKKKLSPKN